MPKLFVNNSTGKIGLVGYWDVVAFDEFAGQKKTTTTDPEEVGHQNPTPGRWARAKTGSDHPLLHKALEEPAWGSLVWYG